MYKLYQVEAKSDQVPVARCFLIHADKHNPKLQPVCAKHHTPNFAFLHTRELLIKLKKPETLPFSQVHTPCCKCTALL